MLLHHQASQLLKQQFTCLPHKTIHNMKRPLRRSASTAAGNSSVLNHDPDALGYFL
jgi:hypothetical protein